MGIKSILDTVSNTETAIVIITCAVDKDVKISIE